MNICDYDEFFKTHNLGAMNFYLSLYQFTEEMLIKTLDYYDSSKCLSTQKNLTPYFCFYHLYNKESDSADIFTSYVDILEYFRYSDISNEKIYDIYVQTIKDKKISIYNNIII
jgi:hypothetical protein